MHHVNGTALSRTSAAERPRPATTATPLVDVYESQDQLLLVADLPGASAESIHVHLEKGELTLSGKRTDAAQGKPVQVEQRPRDYYRAFSVPEGVDGSKIEASFSAGVLRVTLPKSEGGKARRIPIKTA